MYYSRDIEEMFWRGHEIIPNLWVGGAENAEEMRVLGGFDVFMDVRNYFPGFTLDPDEEGHVNPMVLDVYAKTIDDFLKEGKKIFVHCHAGIERSPLVVAWYLALYKDFADLESAYRFVIDKHPMTRRRGQWVEWAERDRRGLFGKKKEDTVDG